jgi:hypothetical protein
MGEEEAPPAAGADTGGEKQSDGKPSRGRRNRNRQRQNKQRLHEATNTPTYVPKEKFVGRSDDLKGFTYDVTTSKGGVAYTRTTEEIARHVGEKYTNTGSFIRTAIMTLKVPVQTRPSPPVETGTPPAIDPVDQEIFREEIRLFVKTKGAIESTMKSLYDLIWGQCSESLRSRLRGDPNYTTYSVNADSLALLKGIRAEMTGFRTKQYLSHSLHLIMRDFYNLIQGKHRSNQEYYDEFNSMVETAEESGVTIGPHPAGITECLTAIAANIDNPTTPEKFASIQLATQRYLSVAFLLGADRVRYGTLIEEIENEFLRNKGTSSSAGTYPTTVAEAYDYLCNYKKDPKNLSRLLGQNIGGNPNTGVSFIQDGSPNDNGENTHEQAFATHGGPAGGRTKQKTTCRRCGIDGHNSIDCDSGKDKVDIYRQSLKGNLGVSQLIHAVDWNGTPSADTGADEGSNFVFLQESRHIKTTTKSVSFKSDGAIKCTEFAKDGTVAKTHKSTIFSQANSGIPSTWYLLDNQSTCDIVSNPKLVNNIRQVEGYMQLATQAGSTTTNWMADVPGYYRPVWFHPGGIANILSMVNMIAKYHVTYDSHEGEHPNQFCVHKDDGTIRKFLQSKRGLYYLDTATTENHTVLVTTVEENKSKYTNRDYSRAKLARQIQILVGRPELKDFLRYLENNALPNSPVQQQDAINALDIFGRDVDSLKGKITKQQLEAVLGAVANNLPRTIMATYREITLCIDIMFVNQIPFLMSISKHIRFITCEVLENRKAPTLIQALKRIHGIYRKRGFVITNILGDGEFECTRGAVAADIRSELNICGEGEHVPDIERAIRTTKERTRCTYNATPIEHYPPRMVIEMVFMSVFWLNAFPHRLGISQTLSPRTIVTGLHIDYHKHCRIEFGQYVQTHEQHDNSMAPRTVGALALRPTGNQQGGYYFYSLMSGKRLHRTHWTELPMPAEVRDRVHALARRARANRGLTFTDSDGNDLDAILSDSDDDDDSDFDPDDDENSYASSEDSDYDPSDASDDDVSLPDTIAGVGAAGGLDPAEPTGVGNTSLSIEPTGVDNDNNDDADDEESVDDNAAAADNDANTELETFVNELETELDDEIDEIDQLDSDYRPSDDENESDAEMNADAATMPINDHELNDIHADAARQQSSADNDMTDKDNDEESNDDEDSDPDTPRPRLRRNRTRSYGHLKGRTGDGSLPTVARPHEFRGGKYQAHVILQSIVMTQYNLKQGIKKFGDNGKAAVLVELQQLYDRNVMEPVMKSDLTPAERKGALRYLMFIKEKRCGKIKGRGCADGRSQREYMSKEETSSPTVATEALILTCVIDAIEGRDVATCDIPGAFMQSDMKGKVVMKLEGVMAEVIIKIDPKLYTRFVTKENGKDVIYVILTKALYGTLQAALLF